MIIGAILASVVTVMFTIAEDGGVSSEALNFYGAIAQFILCLIIDLYFYYFGYSNGMHVCIYFKKNS